MLTINSAQMLREISLELLEFFQFRNLKVKEGIGPDGGRDIEAETIGRDESQSDYLAKWWIELKFRSKGYLEIGNIEDKIRRAGNNNVQYFLLITNAFISENTLTRLESRARESRVLFRYWDKHELKGHLKTFQENFSTNSKEVEKISILDRYKEYLRLEDLIGGKEKNVILIEGSAGIGKSSLTKYLIYKLQNKYCIGIIDCRLNIDLGFSLKMLAASFGRQGFKSPFVYSEGQRLSEAQRLQLLIEHCFDNNNRTILLLDNFEEVITADGRIHHQLIQNIIRHFLDYNTKGSKLLLTSRVNITDRRIKCEDKYHEQKLSGWDINFVHDEYLPLAEHLNTKLSNLHDDNGARKEALAIFVGNPLALKIANNLCAHHDFKEMIALIENKSDPAKSLIEAYSKKIPESAVEALTKMAIFNRPMTKDEILAFVCDENELNQLISIFQLVEEMDCRQHSYQLHPITAIHFYNKNEAKCQQLVRKVIGDVEEFIKISEQSIDEIYNHSLARQLIRMNCDIGRFEKAAELLITIGTRAVSMGDVEYLKELLESLRDKVSQLANAKLLKVKGHILDLKGDFEACQETYQDMLEEGNALQDEWVRAAALNGLGTMERHRGNSESAISLYIESLTIRQNVNDKVGQSNSHHNLGATYLEAARFEQAKFHLETALKIRRSYKDLFRVSASQLYISEYYCQVGDFATARKTLDACIKTKKKFQDLVGLLWAELLLVKIDLMDDDYDISRVYPRIKQSLDTAEKINKPRDIMLSHAFAGAYFILASDKAEQAWIELRAAKKIAKQLNDTQYQAISDLSSQIDDVENIDSLVMVKARELVRKLKV